MSIINTLSLKSNSQIKINFDGGDLSLLFRCRIFVVKSAEI